MVEAANLALLVLAVAMAVPVLFLAVQLGAALLPGQGVGSGIIRTLPAHRRGGARSQ